MGERILVTYTIFRLDGTTEMAPGEVDVETGQLVGVPVGPADEVEWVQVQS